MSDKEQTQKKSWFKGLKAEFKKVIWPDRITVECEKEGEPERLTSEIAAAIEKRLELY